MKTFEVEIEGAPPGLLMRKFSVEAETELEDEIKKTKRDHGTVEEQAEQAAYRDGDGHLCQPAEHIYQAMCKAAVEFQIKGRGKKTYKDSIKGNVLIEPDLIPHVADDYLIDSRPARVIRARIMRHRPHLRQWRLAFTVQLIDGDAVPARVLNRILARAGESVGIGDYRPRFGRFTVTKFKAVAA